MKDRLSDFSIDFRELLKKHEFENFFVVDLDIQEPYDSANFGFSEESPNILLIGCSHKTQCPDCCENEEHQH